MIAKWMFLFHCKRVKMKISTYTNLINRIYVYIYILIMRIFGTLQYLSLHQCNKCHHTVRHRYSFFPVFVFCRSLMLRIYTIVQKIVCMLRLANPLRLPSRWQLINNSWFFSASNYSYNSEHQLNNDDEHKSYVSRGKHGCIIKVHS